MTNKKIPYFAIYAMDFMAYKDKLSPQDFFDVIEAISEICMFGETEKTFEGKYQKLYFEHLKENLEKQQKKYKIASENGSRGGAPDGNKNAKSDENNPETTKNQAKNNQNPDEKTTKNQPNIQPKNNLKSTKKQATNPIQTKPNTNQIQTNPNTNTNQIQIINTSAKKDFCADVVTPNAEWTQIFSDWLEYKRERRQAYQSLRTAQHAFDNLLRISGSCVAAAREIVSTSIANNWAGMFPLRNKGSPSKADAALTAAVSVLKKIEKGEV
ncbi:hypothetical protein NO1_0554 [Candidatus Termititenax aidoneus]|uniref:Uncharacterized protein n=1 Tax=Termititenax aidoneus TaxID=2218524 RepID=A0A388TA40_TERA1|nr:hypothetical protein NO1_0554 [Candidatus Termititenax aidoneus]